MQEFLTNNTVSCNLMSLTGYRTLVILKALLESPKSNDELNECFLNDQYINEKFSSDTLRIYINSLRAIGCEITKANKSSDKKYVLLSHPFDYDIPKPQRTALAKLYKNLYDKVSLNEIIVVENLFKKLSCHIKNKETKDFLSDISKLKNIDRSLLHSLLKYCKNNNHIVILYNSPESGSKEIELVVDKISFMSEKLYLFGNNLTHKQYSYLPVDKIIEIRSVKLRKVSEIFNSNKVIYEVYNYDKFFNLEFDEKIIEQHKNKIVVESAAVNEFSLIQRILYMSNNCKVISPVNFKEKILVELKKMAGSYENV